MDATALRDRIAADLVRLAGWIPCHEAQAPAVSAWSVGMHLDHLLRTLARGLPRLIAPVADPTVPPPVPAGRIVLLTGWIPRGRGQAPEMVRPQPTDAAALTAAFAAAQAQLAALDPHLPAIDRDPTRIAHPLLGGFTPRQWLRFHQVHQRHHAKIIRDILGRS